MMDGIPNHNKPLVVLGGWLGCQPKHLRKYKELYEELGWNVLVKIATPTMVIMASVSKPSIPTQDISSRMKVNNAMVKFSMDILLQIQSCQGCPMFVIHVFSNGGCFVWETMRQILFCTKQPHEIVKELRPKLVGVVFDSSPASYVNQPNLIKNAMKHIHPFYERIKVQLWYYLIRQQNNNDDADDERANEFWCGMRNSTSSLPQLYIYSDNDSLTPFEPLDELVHHRQQILGKNIIHSLTFQNSPHCSHLRTHTKEYTQAIQSFLQTCTSNHNPTLSSSTKTTAAINNIPLSRL